MEIWECLELLLKASLGVKVFTSIFYLLFHNKPGENLNYHCPKKSFLAIHILSCSYNFFKGRPLRPLWRPSSHSCVQLIVLGRPLSVLLLYSSPCLMFVVFFPSLSQPIRMTFGQKPDNHMELMNTAEKTVLDGTSKWSCKIAITGGFGLRFEEQKLFSGFVAFFPLHCDSRSSSSKAKASLAAAAAAGLGKSFFC